MAVVDLALKVIDQWLAYQAHYADLVGIQASIRKSGNLIFSKAYGFANQQSKQKYTTAHVGRIASHSKIFTTILALRLQEQGALRLNDCVVDHLPQFRRHRDKRFKNITLHNLLTNRSGLLRDGVDAPFYELEAPFLSREDLEQTIAATDLVYAPNLHTKYSNIGFSLMGLVLEKVGQADYQTLVTQHVLDRLGKNSFLPDYQPSKKQTYAFGHSRDIYGGKRKIFKHTSTNAMCAAGGFFGNTESTTHFLHELYNTDTLLPYPVRRDLQKTNTSGKMS